MFADRRQLLRALASVWEGVESAGMDGGHLRGLFADGLEQAAVLLDQPGLAAEAPRWREIADRWHALAETALPDDVPAIARLRTLTATVTGAVAEGDAGAAERAAAAEELWQLRAEHADEPPLDEERLAAVLAGWWAPGRDPRRGRGGDPPRCRPGQVIASPGDRPRPWPRCCPAALSLSLCRTGSRVPPTWREW